MRVIKEGVRMVGLYTGGIKRGWDSVQGWGMEGGNWGAALWEVDTEWWRGEGKSWEVENARQ